MGKNTATKGELLQHNLEWSGKASFEGYDLNKDLKKVRKLIVKLSVRRVFQVERTEEQGDLWKNYSLSLVFWNFTVNLGESPFSSIFARHLGNPVCLVTHVLQFGDGHEYSEEECNRRSGQEYEGGLGNFKSYRVLLAMAWTFAFLLEWDGEPLQGSE